MAAEGTDVPVVKAISHPKSKLRETPAAWDESTTRDAFRAHSQLGSCGDIVQSAKTRQYQFRQFLPITP